MQIIRAQQYRTEFYQLLHLLREKYWDGESVDQKKKIDFKFPACNIDVVKSFLRVRNTQNS